MFVDNGTVYGTLGYIYIYIIRNSRLNMECFRTHAIQTTPLEPLLLAPSCKVGRAHAEAERSLPTSFWRVRYRAIQG